MKFTDANRDIWIASLLFVLLWWFTDEVILLIVGAVYMGMCYGLPQMKKLNHDFWAKLAAVLQAIFQPIIFGLIFLFFLVPIGFLFQIFKNKNSDSKSTFTTIDRTMDDQFFKVPW